MEFRSTRKGNSIYDEMKSKIFEQRLLERQLAYQKFEWDDELSETLDMIEDEYIFNLFKLDEISLLENKPEEVKRVFCEQKIYIEQADISEKEKNNLILTTTCLFTRIYPYIKHLNDEQLYLLGTLMKNVNLEDYPVYGKILNDNHFIVRANELSKNNNGRMEEDSFALCDECNGCELSEPSYQKAMKRLLPVLKI